MEVIGVLNLIKKFLLLFKHQTKSDQSAIGKKVNSAQRIRNLYDPFSDKPFRISRSKLELFLTCNRCFYIDRKLGVGHPDIPAFSLNIAVDELLKKEFDRYRIQQMPHPICLENNINVLPLNHKDLFSWRNSLHEGVQYSIPGTNIVLHGGIDDVWINPITQEVFVVDYKATSKKGEITLEGEWQARFKRQAEIYQWLLRKNDLKVSDVAYFVYCNALKDKPAFNNVLHFSASVIPYNGNDCWVEPAIMQAYECLQSNIIPASNESCEYCQYWQAVSSI